MNTKQIAADVRTLLKDQLPEWTFSVRLKRYAGGSSIYLSLMSGPEQVAEGYRYMTNGYGGVRVPYNDDHPFEGYAQLNHYQLLSDSQHEQENRLSNGVYLTSKGWEVMRKAAEILSIAHWDESDTQSDYFCTNFYRHVEIGQWNRPYTVKEGK